MNYLTTADTDTFVFMDPPYHHSTRPNNIKLYDYEMDNNDHVQLLQSLLQLKCNCMIIHPKCNLYDGYLREWRILQLKIRYHNKTSIENLYMNYNSGPLQIDKYLGIDCWDRQRIKRKSERLISKLSVLPEQERQYLINRIINKFSIQNTECNN